MKKTVSKVISFPKPRRTEQNGLTQRSFPARWLGMLLLTTMGAAWAISPASDNSSSTLPKIDSVVFEGEPQVVAQLMGTVVGPNDTPGAELKALSALGGADRRVVVGQRAEGDKESSPRSLANFRRAIENVESDFSESGSYPAIPGSDGSFKGVGYRTNGQAFKLEGSALAYDSRTGITSVDEESDAPDAKFAITGHLSSVSEGWGPWKRERTDFSRNGRKVKSDLDWLSDAPVTPAWSARMYFPVNTEHTGYLFRKADGSSAYTSGELLYDAVSGTFQMKLRRDKRKVGRQFSANLLEQELSSHQGCKWVGDVDLLADFGFVKKDKDDGLVSISSPKHLQFSAHEALDGLSLASFSRHKDALSSTKFVGSDDEKDRKVAAVGRLNVVDKLGQVHQLRVRAGRGDGYDWIVGQLCPLEEADQDLAVSSAYDDAYDRKVERSIIAGK